MNFDCGNINTENMSYSQKFAAIIARMHKLKFGNMLTGVSEIEFKTMSAISRISKSGDVKVSDIARYLELSAPAVSRTMKALEEKEYIERQTDKQDRRNTFVKLTKKGEEQQKAWMKSFEEFSEAIFARLGDEKSNQLLEDLEAFVKASKEEMKAREEAKK
jgi:transcriptional regulator, MarR family